MNNFIRLEIDASLDKATIDATIQTAYDTINTANGTVVSHDEDLNESTYCYNVTIAYTTP